MHELGHIQYVFTHLSSSGGNGCSKRVLKEFLKWFKSKKRSPNLSATSDQGKEGRLPVYNRVLQPSFVPVSHDTIMHIHPAPVS